MLALIVLLSILGFFIVSKIQRQIILRQKSELLATRFFGLPYLVFGLIFCSLCVFVGLGLLGSRKERKRKKSAAILRNCFYPAFCSACSATYSNDRVLLPVTPSALLLSLSVSLGFNEY